MASFSDENLDPVLVAISRPSSLTTNVATGTENLVAHRASLPAHLPSSIGPVRTQGRRSKGGDSAKHLYTVQRLKEECKSRGLKCTGLKKELLDRLAQHGFTLLSTSNAPHESSRQDSGPTASTSGCATLLPCTASTSTLPPQVSAFQEVDDDSDPLQSARSLNSEQVVKDAAELVQSFEEGFGLGHGDEDEDEDEAGKENEMDIDEYETIEERTSDDVVRATSGISTKSFQPPAAAKATEWADEYILQTRRKSGRVTEQAVIAQWKQWLPQAIHDRLVPDHIVDANLIIHYLKYAATRQLLTKRGTPKQTNERLSASSLKKIMTMLGRVRGRQEDDHPELKDSRPASNSRTLEFYKAVMIQAQRHRLQTEDFDIAKNTILDQELQPEQFNEITAAIFSQNQVPTIVKSHFSWTWQATTLNRGDEVINLPITCLQPYHVNIPDFHFSNGQVSGQGRRLFGVLSLFYQTKVAKPGKTAPAYSFVLPNRNILRCPIGALSIQLQYMFDQEHLCSKVSRWDWTRPSTFRNQLLMFGKTVDKGFTGDTFGKMYQNFLDRTSVTTKKKTHLARRTMPTILEDMGVPSDQVDATGNWAGNERRETYTAKIPKLAVVALAGFAVGESYSVPWASIDVPIELQKRVFPFVEGALVCLQESGSPNEGTYNFLRLLVELRPFFWRTMAAISLQFPNSGLLQRIKIIQDADAKAFFNKWPSALKAREEVSLSDGDVSMLFHETPTRHAVSAMSYRLRGLEDNAQAQTRLMERLIARTDPLSPSKQPPGGKGAVIRFPGSVSTSINSINCQAGEAIVPSRVLENYSQDVHMSSPPSSPVLHPCRLFDSDCLSSQIPISPFGSPTRVSNLPLPSFSKQMDIFTPYVLDISQKTYYVLPILPSLPSLPQPRSSHDLIIPSPTAYTPQVLPTFKKSETNWQSIFSKVTNPVQLWDCYAPRSLGDYPDVKTIWQSWSEGTVLDDIGRLPPLRLIENKWGSLKNGTTGKGRLPSWRPRNDAKARKIWGNYHFFVKRIETMIAEGQSSDDVIQALEVRRQELPGSKTINALHSALQIKKK